VVSLSFFSKKESVGNKGQEYGTLAGKVLINVKN
jgi:hypothetical protein